MRVLLFIFGGVAIAAVIGLIITRLRGGSRRQRERDETLSSAAATNDITAVKVGGVLRLPPFGKMVAPIETFVKKRHRYSAEGSSDWYELVCVQGKRELLVEWWREDGLNVCGGYEDENPTMIDLGLTEARLTQFDEEARGSFEWDGIEWAFEDAGEQFYFEDDGDEREGFYNWEFVAPGGRTIAIEKWAGDARFYVYHTWPIDPEKIEVFEGGR